MPAPPRPPARAPGSHPTQPHNKIFASFKKIRTPTHDQICEVPGIGRKTAETIA
ncbi:hypothetical protein, partial [Streptomyces sp. NPDC054837]